MTFLRSTDVRLAKQYLLNLIRAHFMFDFNLINEPIFPNNFM